MRIILKNVKEISAGRSWLSWDFSQLLTSFLYLEASTHNHVNDLYCKKIWNETLIKERTLLVVFDVEKAYRP
jgi:hypothetical protein